MYLHVNLWIKNHLLKRCTCTCMSTVSQSCKNMWKHIYMYVFPKYHCWVTLYGAQDVVKSNNIYLVLEYRCKSNIIFIIKIWNANLYHYLYKFANSFWSPVLHNIRMHFKFHSKVWHKLKFVFSRFFYYKI